MQHIDAKGKNCPLPVILAKKAIDGGADSFTIEVDDEIACKNLEKLAAGSGFDVSYRADGRTLLFYRYEGAFPRPDTHVPPMAEARPPLGETVYFAASETLGDGAEELGRTLMEMFFFTLAQGEPPAGVVLMNGGVRLTVEGGQTAAHLVALEKAGCPVLVCGTCLQYYGLADCLAAGQVSNMYEIAAFLDAAEKVVRL